MKQALTAYASLNLDLSNTDERNDSLCQELRRDIASATQSRRDIDSLLRAVDLSARERGALEAQHAAVNALRKAQMNQLTMRLAQLSERQQTRDRLKALADSCTAAAEAFKIKRTGFFWDVAGGLALDFRDRRFDNSWVTTGGIWTTLGYESEKWFSAGLMGRFLLSPDQTYRVADSLVTGEGQSIDCGARLTIDPPDGRFTFSGEALY
ncbi:MAG: hypothetical protein WAT74_04685, partial [Flavobacteriales bacterium]